MPRKPMRPCSYPGCPELTEGRYCPEHEREMRRRYEASGRDPATRRRYDARWGAISRAYREEHPWCELCRRKGRYAPSEAVHHIKPKAEGGTDDPSNLMALCKGCHSALHARGSFRGRGRGAGADPAETPSGPAAPADGLAGGLGGGLNR